MSLAETISRAATTPGLWDALRAGIPPVHAIEDHIQQLDRIYGGLLAGASLAEVIHVD